MKMFIFFKNILITLVNSDEKCWGDREIEVGENGKNCSRTND